ncbi:uncharacterized protein LOC111250805 [Varroa destructor]|uniref:Uncharacterized protein n=1 Tax=Varroa destructor TaxID=109461 RepID=A0A7M7K7H1_VARDE|nr:uncharacterized protein LOC111250805 [Varroa destructor]
MAGERRWRLRRLVVGTPSDTVKEPVSFSYQRQPSLSVFFFFTLLMLVELIASAEGGKFHGYKKVFYREEHGDHRTYYDDLHHGKYKKSAIDSKEIFHKQDKDRQERVYARSTSGGNTFSETILNPVAVDARNPNVPNEQSPAKKHNPRIRLWQDPGDFQIKFSSSFQDFITSLNTSSF